MDQLLQHEAFLRAIFDAPADDTPRLVYADFLQEHGDEDRAAYIRYECELAQLSEDDPQTELLRAQVARLRQLHSSPTSWPWGDEHTVRGFPLPPSQAVVTAADLTEPDRLRERVVRSSPEWYGTKAIRVTPPLRLDSTLLDVLFALPFFRQATEWNLSGHEINVRAEGDLPTYLHTVLTEVVIECVIVTTAVESLAQHRGARRLTALDLRNNGLDNDAARALVKSPYLDNLKRLDLLEGNRFLGKVWQQVIQRFGEDVAG
jgi:uncharacterized protein (TIGR02996 family)